jgi:N-acetyl-gamma-glutamyl-phosphate reductase
MSANNINVGIIGATGYVGQELVRLLHQHPTVTIAFVSSKSYAGKPFSTVYPAFRGVVELPCIADDQWQTWVQQHPVDVLFFALPHGLAAHHITPELLKTTKVIDCGADFRLHNPHTYATWYETEHPTPQLLSHAVYGLTEWQKKPLATATLVANPGCYPTCTLLPLLPLLKAGLLLPQTIVVDAKSGVSGAGRGLALGTHFCETAGSMKPYKVAGHRHTPEIEQGLALFANTETTITFTPHLVPLNRGMCVTTTASLTDASLTWENLHAVYQAVYNPEATPFVRLCAKGETPETNWVKGTNFCDIAWAIDTRTNRVILTSVIDNLLKGAAGQAVHNFNIMNGLAETLGLDYTALLPA